MYEEIADGYNELHQEEQLNKLRIIKGNLALTPTTKVLDVGCGTGLSAFLNCNLQGIDPSAEMLKHCSFPTVQGRAEQLPFEDNSFDIVISITALHHCDVAQALKEMHRVTKNLAVLSILSQHAQEIERYIKQNFSIDKIIRERHDIVYFLSK